ncbi:MAG TPA: alpha/beta hydrolase [Acidimicrobiales bacterium]|nr:alpha/beta hydrolase [Acidimicrobiales bacterium]
MEWSGSVERIRTDDGVELAVYDFGGPDGAGGQPRSSSPGAVDPGAMDLDAPALLLAHATGFHARCWLPVVAVLREHFHCYAFDERGHGDSSTPPDGDFDWHRFADDALGVVDHFGLRRPFAVGHSCGGALLLLAEAARPGTFRALYTFEPVVMPFDEPPPAGSLPDNPLAAGARKRRSEFPSYEAALENFSSKPPMAGFRPDALEAYVRFGFEPLDQAAARAGGPVRLKCSGEDEARTYEAAAFNGVYPRLGEVRCPVTLACGELTTAFDEAAMLRNEARLPLARVEVLPGLTHFGPLEGPDLLVARVLHAFLSA